MSRIPWAVGVLSLAASLEAQQLDLSNPVDALKANRKTQCSLVDGEPVTMSWQGSVYGRVPGERDRELFGVEGMSVRACTTVKDAKGGYGYRMVSRELMLYLDPTTNEILRQWKNPWTGKTVEVVHVANDPVNSRPMVAVGEDQKPFRFAGIVKNGTVLMSAEVPLFYTNPLAGEYQDYVGGTYQAIELFNFFVREKDLVDASKPGVEDLHIAWGRVAPWLPWMEMGSLAGQMIFTSAGVRLRNWEDLPDLMKVEIGASYPEYKSPPPADDARPNETSWTYFKKRIDAKRKSR